MNNPVMQATVANLALIALFVPQQGRAATLRSDTITAWEDYVRTADASLNERVRCGGRFLWSLEEPERGAKLRSGEIIVDHAPGPSPRKVPGGLIHHWIGAVFLPNFKIDDILAVTRDYDRYKDFFSPSVVDSKATRLDGPADKFSMLLMNKAFFLKTALDADYESTIVRIDDCRVYSISKTTRLQEVEEYGQPGEHKIPQGEGTGVIWKLHSIARLEQRDGGVYVEIEAIALSREIPPAIRFLVDPIVRRVSHNSLLVSLQQTEDAVRRREAFASRPAVIPTVAGQFGTVSSAFSSKRPVNIDSH
jgi:hypothetical protein